MFIRGKIAASLQKLIVFSHVGRCGWIVDPEPTWAESLKSKFPTVPEGRMGVMSDRLMITVEWSGGGQVGFGVPALERLMHADAWQSVGLGRRETLWQIRALGAEPLPLFAAADARALLGDNRGPVERGNEPDVDLLAMRLGEAVVEDYRSLSLTLRAHPLALLRPRLRDLGYTPARGLESLADGKRVGIAGLVLVLVLVLVRQRPGTANGIVFVTREDETRHANLVV